MKSLGKKILFTTEKSTQIVEIDDIIYCKAEGNYTKVFIVDQDEPILVTRTLKHVEYYVLDFNFFRVTRGVLVNIGRIMSFDQEDHSWIKVETGDHFPVAVRRRKDFIEYMKYSTIKENQYVN